MLLKYNQNLPKTSELTRTLQENIGVTRRGLRELNAFLQAWLQADIN